MTPLELYDHYLATEQYQPDPQQRQAVLHLQRVYEQLNAVKTTENV